jgi:hypothetical protein
LSTALLGEERHGASTSRAVRCSEADEGKQRGGEKGFGFDDSLKVAVDKDDK